MSRYKIEITEITTEVQMAGHEWKPVDGNPDTKYAYTPEIYKQVSVTRTVYMQNVEVLDLPAVIKAINSLE